MNEPRGSELIKRYKENYGIPFQVDITEEMILKHWELEKLLTQRLLKTTSENRWEIFEQCYNMLYKELSWLNKYVDTARNNTSKNYETWVHLIGKPPKKIYEIGSGKGELISYLANCGYECRATEITRERGEKFIPDTSNLTWDISDGVHLDKFTSKDYYDVVISNQVIEHLHPDDVSDHFKNVYRILTNNGRYIFSTPHCYLGPADVSRVFKYEKPICMHLKEYTYKEIKELLDCAGFQNVRAVLKLPQKVSKILRIKVAPKPSKIYFAYLILVERLISFLPFLSFRRKLANLSRIILFPSDIFIISKKI